MTLIAACGNCGATYDVPDEHAGKVARCAKCHAKIVIPAVLPEVPEEEPLGVVPGEHASLSQVVREKDGPGFAIDLVRCLWAVLAIVVVAGQFVYWVMLSQCETVMQEASLSALAAVMIITGYVLVRAAEKIAVLGRMR